MLILKFIRKEVSQTYLRPLKKNEVRILAYLIPGIIKKPQN